MRIKYVTLGMAALNLSTSAFGVDNSNRLSSYSVPGARAFISHVELVKMLDKEGIDTSITYRKNLANNYYGYISPRDNSTYVLLHQIGVVIDSFTYSKDNTDKNIYGYFTEAELAVLANLGFTATKLYSEGTPQGDMVAGYPTSASISQTITSLATSYPKLTTRMSLGKTTKGKDINALKIASNTPSPVRNKINLQLTGGMHGDEVVGVDLLLRLSSFLLSSAGNNPRIDKILSQANIWIVPSENPDGLDASTRSNANYVDLNRDYPNPPGIPALADGNREQMQPETQAFMNFYKTVPFVLAANLHGGALVVNLPWDAKPNTPGNYYQDYLFLQRAALTYSEHNSPMWVSEEFKNGLTFGYEWYPVYGGLQDWAIYFTENAHVTIEVSNIKKPNPSTFDSFWEDNRESLLLYLENGLQVLKGNVIDKTTKKPIVQATIAVKDNLTQIHSRPDGTFAKLLLPGTYNAIEISAPNYKTITLSNMKVNDAVAAGTPTDITVELEAL